MTGLVVSAIVVAVVTLGPKLLYAALLRLSFNPGIPLQHKELLVTITNDRDSYASVAHRSPMALEIIGGERYLAIGMRAGTEPRSVRLQPGESTTIAASDQYFNPEREEFELGFSFAATNTIDVHATGPNRLEQQFTGGVSLYSGNWIVTLFDDPDSGVLQFRLESVPHSNFVSPKP